MEITLVRASGPGGIPAEEWLTAGHRIALAIAEVRGLLRRWARVPPGGTLRLTWPLARGSDTPSVRN